MIVSRRYTLIRLGLSCVLGTMPHAFAGSITYSYDSLNRITNASYSAGASQQFEYDAAGNRLTRVSINPLVVSQTPDQALVLGSSSGPIPVTVDNPNVPTAVLGIEGFADLPSLVDAASFAFGGSGIDRTVTITPAPGHLGQTTITLVANDGSTSTSTSFLLKVSAGVVARHVFYNRSAWDGNDPGASSGDDLAIAADKTALLPGGIASFANYTSYNKGINGIMIDVAGLPGVPVAEDFVLRVGNDNHPGAWVAAPSPVVIAVRPGAGTGGSSRITLNWPDNVIQKQWLQITVLATPNTGLIAPDVFYFGNAIGESGNSPTDAQVDVSDENAARQHPRNFLSPATVDDVYDYNRDQRVDVSDENIARQNNSNFLTALKLIDLSAVGAVASVARDNVVTDTEAETLPTLSLQAVADGGFVLEFRGASSDNLHVQTTTAVGSGTWLDLPADAAQVSPEGRLHWSLPFNQNEQARFFRVIQTVQ